MCSAKGLRDRKTIGYVTSRRVGEIQSSVSNTRPYELDGLPIYIAERSGERKSTRIEHVPIQSCDAHLSLCSKALAL